MTRHDTFLTRNASNFIKAMAIIMMVTHHFWGFPDWVLPMNDKYSLMIAGKDLEAYFGQFCKICVSLFAFITGYVAFINPKYHNLKYRFMKCLELLSIYWVTLIFMYIVGAIAGEPMGDIKRVLLNLTGIKYNGAGLQNPHAWYVFFYIQVMMITVPLIQRIFRGNHDWIKFWITFAAMAITTKEIIVFGLADQSWAYEFLYWSQIILIGYMTAKKCIFNTMDTYIAKFIGGGYQRCILYLLVLALLIPLRQTLNNSSLNLDFIWTPLLIFCAVSVGRMWKRTLDFMNPVIRILASNSTNIWFLHALAITPNKSLQWIAYLPHFGVLIVLWVLVMCTAVSMVLRPVQNKILELISTTSFAGGLCSPLRGLPVRFRLKAV